jgi:hypothetical protein
MTAAPAIGAMPLVLAAARRRARCPAAHGALAARGLAASALRAAR